MSNHYDFRCVTCSTPDIRVRAGIDHNHGEEQLARLLKATPQLAAASGAVLAAFDGRAADMYRENELPGWFYWLANHLGHDIRVFDEYGRECGQCWERVRCGECLDWHNCTLPLGHGGAHSMKAVEGQQQPTAWDANGASAEGDNG